MAFLIKNQHRPNGSLSQPDILAQWIQVTQPDVALPQNTTGQLFRVKGGKILVRALVATVGTAIQSSDPVLSVNSKALTAAGAASGTAVAIASTVDISSLESGGMLFVEGDGTAIVKSNAGGAFIGTNSGNWIAPQGEIYATTTASKTGTLKWDLWYQPLDAGAFVEVAVLTNSILTAAI